MSSNVIQLPPFDHLISYNLIESKLDVCCISRHQYGDNVRFHRPTKRWGIKTKYVLRDVRLDNTLNCRAIWFDG